MLTCDAGLMNEFRIEERSKLQFRAEFFNVLKHTVFGDPNHIIPGGGLGGIRSAADPRIGQLALKLRSYGGADFSANRKRR